MTEMNPDALIQERLVADPGVCGGQVCVKGTRIPAALILGGVMTLSQEQATLGYGMRILAWLSLIAHS